MKRRFLLDKLIRDKVFDNIERHPQAESEVVPIESDEKMRSYFHKKFMEEAEEVITSKDNEEAAREMADLLEVIHGYAEWLGVSFEEVEAARQRKLDLRGGFSNRRVVKTVYLEESLEWAQYSLEWPEKYPEVDG